jgi:FkbM family methyltransferase
MDNSKKDKVSIQHVRGHDYYLREDTMDKYVAEEAFYNRATFTPNDIWLDIGGNIGVFPVKYADKVKYIHTYEPDVDNLELLTKNLQLNNIHNCHPHEQAVVWDDRKATEFWLNTKRNKGSHSMFIHRGRKCVIVPCVNINTILRQTKANKIKIDIEGGEYDLLKAIRNWDAITEVIFEYHIAVLRDFLGLKLAEVYNLLTLNGFEVLGPSPTALKRNRFVIVHAVKPITDGE